MADATLRVEQSSVGVGRHRVQLWLSGVGAPVTATADGVVFTVTGDDRERVRWYLEDYLEYPLDPAPRLAAGVEARLDELGGALFDAVFAGADARVLWARLLEHVPRLRVEVASDVADATALPWELLRDPRTGVRLALQAASFVRVHSSPAIPVQLPEPEEQGEAGGSARLRVLLVICRPAGGDDVPFRSVASRLVAAGAETRDVLDLDVLRPPTYARLAAVLEAADAAGRPYHVVHFDGHGTYLDTTELESADRASQVEDSPGLGGSWSPHRYGYSFISALRPGSHGYLVFEHPTAAGANTRQLVDGPALGQLLARTGVAVLVLNACRSAYAEAPTQPQTTGPVDHEHGDTERGDSDSGATGAAGPAAAIAAVADAAVDPTAPDAGAGGVHGRVRGYGSLALEVADAGVAGVVAMRYSVYVVTAAQFVADLYTALLGGQSLGTAVTAGRRQLAAKPDRTIAFDPVPLQDWPVPVVYETVPLTLFTSTPNPPVHIDITAAGKADTGGAEVAAGLLRVDVGFYGRDETLLALDRAFDTHPTVLLHGYAGAGKTSTAAEFARWYATTGGLAHTSGGDGLVLFSSLEHHTPLTVLLNQLADTDLVTPILQTNNIAWQALSERDRRQVAIQILSQIPVLWIWDNVEPVAGFPTGTASAWTQAEQDQLADFLRDLTQTKAKVLLTSRRDERAWLADLPLRVQLPAMPMRERIQLTQALAARHQHRITDVEDWRPLLRYTDGNPLTITILVGQALRARHTSADEIRTFVDRLRAGETSIADNTAQGRTASLAASLSYGFTHAFTDTERAQLALLHLFQDTIHVTALTAMGHPANPAQIPQVAGLTRDDGIALLDRAAEVGLLTPLGGGYYRIHPALPWYLTQLFTTTYGHPTQPDAVRSTHAYTTTIATLGDHYFEQYETGHHQIINNLTAEEANLLHARTLARRHHRWQDVIGCMQGLRVLYRHVGRHAKWARLVNELVPDLIDPTTNGPQPGRDEHWSALTDYRIDLAHRARDWDTAHHLQTVAATLYRQQAADALATPPDQLTDLHRHRIRTLAVSLQMLGRLQREQHQADCLTAYQQAADLYRRIGARREEGTIAYNLGHAHVNISALRDLDQAEHWYRRSLDLTDQHDHTRRAKQIGQLGRVAYERFLDARQAGQPHHILLQHLNTAADNYQQALRLTPADNPTDLGVYHNQLGNVYDDAGYLDKALHHYQQSIRYYEQTGDRYSAAQTRRNVAITLAQAGRTDDALLYAHAAHRDFETIGPGAAAEIDKPDNSSKP